MKKNNQISRRIVLVVLSIVLSFSSCPLISIAQSDTESTSQTIGTNKEKAQNLLSEEVSFKEEVLMRDAFSKHYIDPKGNRYAVVFPEQVHYWKDNSWLEIDNSLVLDGVSQNYVSKNERFKTQFSATTDSDTLVAIEDGDYKLSWSIAFTGKQSMSLDAKANVEKNDSNVVNMTKTKAHITEMDYDNKNGQKNKDAISQFGKAASEVKYNGVFGDSVDLRYSVLHGKVEEDVIINSVGAFTSYTLIICTNGLKATMFETNDIIFVSPNGDTIFTLDAPWMKDAKGVVSDNIAVTMIQKGDIVLVTYTPSSVWLSESERSYPILIDPSFTTRFYTSNYDDTYVYQGDSASSTRPTETTMKTGLVNGVPRYAYIKIKNIPEFENEWDITDITFSFWVKGTKNPSLNLYEVTGNWSPTTITYANRPTSTLISSSLSGESNGTNVKYTVDLTSWAELKEYYGSLPDFFNSNDWKGFMIYGGPYTSDIGDIEIFSSENSSVSYRPVMVIQYEYYPYDAIEDGAVYSLVNSASNKYLTVDGGNVTNMTNVYQSSKNGTLSQAFRFDYNETNEAYTIRAMCSSNGAGSVIETSFSSSINSTTGYTNSNVRLYNYSASWANDQEWLIYPYQYGNLFAIVLRADPNLALTAYGTSNGTAGGTSSTSVGNVFVSQFTGAANQLWKLESGSIQVMNSINIKEIHTTGETYTIYEEMDWLSFCCPVTEFGDTVTWGTTSSYRATVDSVGRVTTISAGQVAIWARVTHLDGTFDTYRCSIYIILRDGVYYLKNVSNGYLLEYESSTSLQENAVLETYGTGNTEPTARYRMFKIKNLGNDVYSIRSMLDSAMGWTYSESGLVMTTIGKSDDAIPYLAKWKISTDANGYYIYRSASLAHTITASADRGGNISFASHSVSKPLQAWTIHEVATPYHGITLKDKSNTAVVGDTAAFSAVVYSSYSDEHGQNGFTWSVTNGTGSATIGTSTGVLTGVSKGTVTVTATYAITSTQVYSASCTVIIIVLPNGSYFLKNHEYSKYLQIDDNIDSPITQNAITEIHNFDGGLDQKWSFESLNNGYYKIVSDASGLSLTAPSSIDDSISQKTYTGSFNQQWDVTLVNGFYKFSPRSNIICYMSSGNGILDSQGRDVELRDDQLDGKDEWAIHFPRDFTLMYIGQETGDVAMGPLLTEVNYSLLDDATMNGYAYTSLNKDDLLIHLATSKIFNCITHGTQTSIAVTDGELTIQDINQLADDALAGLDFVYLGACLTGMGRENAVNLVNALHSKGAKVILGFTGLARISETNMWTEAFMDDLAKGSTISEAMEVADAVVNNVEAFRNDRTTDAVSRYLVGDDSFRPCP